MFTAARARLVSWADNWLIPHWRHGLHFLSIQVAAFNVVFLASWAILPDDLKAALPSWLVPTAAVLVLLGGMAGRMVQQPGVPK